MRIDNGQFFSASFLDAVNTGITAQGGVTSSAQVSANSLNADGGVVFTVGTGSIRNASNGLFVGYTEEFQSVQLGRAGTNMNLVGTLATSLTASSTVAISGANAVNADRLLADSYVSTPSIQNSGGVLSVLPPTTFVSSVTASNDISASGNFFGDEYHAHGGDANSGYTLLSLGDKPSLWASGGSLIVGNVTNTSQTGISLVGEVTASGIISGASEVNAVTGSFSHLVGNSPITVGDPTEFLQSVTASVISASSAIVAPGIDMANTDGASADSEFYSVNGRKFTMRNQLQSSLADGVYYTFTLNNTDVKPDSVVVGSFNGLTTASLSHGCILTVVPSGSATKAHITIHNETGQTIPDDTPFTASFVIL